MSHGSRQHADLANSVFRGHSRRITDALARHYRTNSNVIGWQTDNEFNTSGSVSYSPSTRREFQLFLQEKYSSIEDLNAAWGGNFWATAYDEFKNIVLPYPSAPVSPSPGHVQDYHRFLAYSVARFQKEQIDILRDANPDWFIFHNLGRLNDFDLRGQFARDLDFLAYDIYPFLSDESNRNGGAAYAQALQLDICRAFAGNFIVPEQQAGLGSQSNFSTLTPEPGEMRRMAYSSVARGADGLLFFRWRPAHFGAEIYWMGLIDHDDVPRRRYAEAAQFADELNDIQRHILGTSVHFDVGIASADFDNQEAHRAYPMGLPSPQDEGVLVHQYCYQRNIACGFVHPEDDLSQLKILVVPHWVMWKDEWTDRIEAFCAGGGTVVFTARTATRNQDNHVLEATAPGNRLSSLVGANVVEIGRLPSPCSDGLFTVGRSLEPSHRIRHPAESASRRQTIRIGNHDAPAAHFYELLALHADTECIGRWGSRFMAGEAAVTSRVVGKGRSMYVGTYLTEQLTDLLLGDLFENSKIRPLVPGLPPGIEVAMRRGEGIILLFLINTISETALLTTVPKGIDLLTGATVGDAPLELKGYDCLVVRIDDLESGRIWM